MWARKRLILPLAYRAYFTARFTFTSRKSRPAVDTWVIFTGDNRPFFMWGEGLSMSSSGREPVAASGVQGKAHLAQAGDRFAEADR